MEDFDHALERIIAGAQSRRVLTDHERTVVAYHEAGHALCAELLPSVDRVHKISIVPRGQALGYTLNLPDEDRYLKTRDELVDYMTMLMGGRAAEQIVFDDVTTGASDDLHRVADIARAMIAEYAMGTSGAVIGTDSAGTVSDITLRIRDEEREQVVHEARQAARELIEGNRAQLEQLAGELLRNEVLDRATIDRIMAEVPRRPSIAAFRRSGGTVGA